MKLMGQGRTSEIYHYTDGLILKLYRTGFSGEAVQNEYHISQLVYDKGLPVPRAVKQMDHATRTGIVFERFEGTTLLSLMIQQPELLEQLSSTMAEIQYKLHQVHDEGNTMPFQKKILEHAIQRVSSFSAIEQKGLLEYLFALPEQRALCHGDYHPDNVMLGKDEGQHCVIDWMTGMTGDPAGDVARTWVILMSGKLPDDAEPAIREGFEQARSLILQRYIEHYIALSGITREQIEAWMLPVAAARLDESLPPSEAEYLLQFVRDRLRLVDETVHTTS
ncbi:phosphotransferase family protein [Paenibacillus amylolyticus]|uniref:phosphotransferase family protein n=1 Tax=Paenibacillus amylolyticus TaxID=1451 RepID=UPI003EBEEEEB